MFVAGSCHRRRVVLIMMLGASFNDCFPSFKIRVFIEVFKFKKLLLYGSVSQGLGTTKFTNLIG